VALFHPVIHGPGLRAGDTGSMTQGSSLRELKFPDFPQHPFLVS
jgi:hypothetical protein